MLFSLLFIFLKNQWTSRVSFTSVSSSLIPCTDFSIIHDNWAIASSASLLRYNVHICSLEIGCQFEVLQVKILNTPSGNFCRFSIQISFRVCRETNLLDFLIKCNWLFESDNGKIIVIKGLVKLWMNINFWDSNMIGILWSLKLVGSQRNSEALFIRNRMESPKTCSPKLDLKNFECLAPIGAQEKLMFVRSVRTCLEQSIFIILAQIFKQSVRNKS